MPVHHGKSFIEARSKVDREHEYTPAEAMRMVKELKRAKFDESVEVHFRTGLNVRHADEQRAALADLRQCAAGLGEGGQRRRRSPGPRRGAEGQASACP